VYGRVLYGKESGVAGQWVMSGGCSGRLCVSLFGRFAAGSVLCGLDVLIYGGVASLHLCGSVFGGSSLVCWWCMACSITACLSAVLCQAVGSAAATKQCHVGVCCIASVCV
jgi:hypothetical protein